MTYKTSNGLDTVKYRVFSDGHCVRDTEYEGIEWGNRSDWIEVIIPRCLEAQLHMEGWESHYYGD